MTDYVYAPKDDPKHRERWREPYDADELAGFERVRRRRRAGASGSPSRPGCRSTTTTPTTAPRSAAKVDQVVGVGATLVVLALDDIPFGGGPQGEAHARAHDVAARPPRRTAPTSSLVPTEYVGTRPSPYLDALAAGVPDDVPIAWTGRAVVNDAITVADAEARADVARRAPPAALGQLPGERRGDGRPPVPRPAAGPRARAARRVLAATWPTRWCSRAPRCSRWRRSPPSLRGDDPAAAWRDDRRRPRLARPSPAPATRTQPAMPSRRWPPATCAPPARLFAEAAVCAAPGLEDEADPGSPRSTATPGWRCQALDVLDGERGVDDGARHGPRLAGLPPATVTVFGPRCSIRPVLGQADDGTWQRASRPSVQHDDNAIDALVAASPLADALGAQRLERRRGRSRGCARRRASSISSSSGSRPSTPCQERARRRSSRGWRSCPVMMSCSLSCLRNVPIAHLAVEELDGPVEEAA